MKAGGQTFERHAEATALGNVTTLTKLLELSAISRVTVRFHPYTRALAGKGAAHTFLNLIGIDVPDLPVEARLNPSIGAMSLEAMRQIGTRLCPGATLRQKQRTAYAMLRIGAQHDDEPAWLIDAEFIRRHDVALTATDGFMQRVWGGTWRDLFPEDDGRRCNRFFPERADLTTLAVFASRLAAFETVARREGEIR